ncbi:hypothetical protein K2X05_06695 [bacterium]|nr:hypothetical protein [bacterium]
MIQAILNLLFALFAFSQPTRNPVPASIMNSVQWEIQKQMTYTSINEKTSLLWTPKTIELQRVDAEALPLFSPYTPNETLYRLKFDIGLGHNMDTAAIYWRQCEATVSLIGENWGQPIIECDEH